MGIGEIIGGGIQIASSVFGGGEKKKAAKKAGRARKGALNEAIAEQESILTDDGFVESQERFADLGSQATDFFQKFGTDPQFRTDLYTQYAKAGDPLYDYYSKKNADAINEQAAARGRFDAGSTMEQIGEAETSLGAKLSSLTDSRVSRELSMNQGLLSSYQRSSEFGANLTSQVRSNISNLKTGIGEASANQANQIGAANAETAGVIGGVATQLGGRFDANQQFDRQLSSNERIAKTYAGAINPPAGNVAAQTQVDAPAQEDPNRYRTAAQPSAGELPYDFQIASDDRNIFQRLGTNVKNKAIQTAAQFGGNYQTAAAYGGGY